MNERPAVEDDRTDQHIGAEGTEPIGEPRRTGAPCVRSADEELDAALACTFPASDPISCFRPSPDDGCSS
jgi:hypothetical protein